MIDNLIKSLIVFLDGYSKNLIISVAVIWLIVVWASLNQAKNIISNAFPDKEEITEEYNYDTSNDDFNQTWNYNPQRANYEYQQDTQVVTNSQVWISESEELTAKILKKKTIKKGEDLAQKQEKLQESVEQKNIEDNWSKLLEQQEILKNVWIEQVDETKKLVEVLVEELSPEILQQLEEPVVIIKEIPKIIIQQPIVQEPAPVTPVKPVVPVENNNDTNQETTENNNTETTTTLDNGTTVTTDGETTTTVETDGTTTTTDGETTTTTQPDGTTSTTDGETTIVTQPDGTTTTTDWDTTTTTEPDGTTTTTDGEITTTTEPDGTTTTTDGETTTTTDPDGTTTTTNWDTTTTVEPEPDTSWDNTNQDETTPPVNDNSPTDPEPVIPDPEPVIEEEIADEDVVTITTEEIQPEEINWYFNNYATINIWSGIQKAIKIATQSTKTPMYPSNPECPNRYSPIATYSNIGLNQHLFSRSKEELPYEDLEKWILIDLTDEFSVNNNGMKFNYKVFNVNNTKIWGITYKTENPNVDYHWIIKVCLRD